MDKYETEDGTFLLVVNGDQAASNEEQEPGEWVFREYTRVEEQEAA